MRYTYSRQNWYTLNTYSFLLVTMTKRKSNPNTLTVILDEDQRRMIDQISCSYRTSKGTIVRNLIDLGVAQLSKADEAI